MSEIQEVPTGQHWYALHTKPHAEYQVAAALASRGLEIFLPTVTSVRSRQKGLDQPFFPCYLFAQIDFARVGYSTVAWTPGLRRVVSFGGRPAIVPQEAIDLIHQRLAEIESQGGLPAHNFKLGDPVQVRSGPLAGLYGVFEGPMSPSERVRVLIEFLGRVNRVEMPLDYLEAVSMCTEERELVPKRTRGRRGRRHKG